MVMRACLTLSLLGVILTVTVTSAQIVRPVSPLGPTTTASSTTGGTGQALINGTAVDTNSSPLSNATVRLRNLQTNQVEQVVNANQLGEFSFLAKPEIPYVVEIVDIAGRIVAVGDVIVPQAGDVAGAMVSIPARLPALAGMFSDTAGSVLSAATNTGITAVQASALPFLSPEQ
jgi:hypothetical protein